MSGTYSCIMLPTEGVHVKSHELFQEDGCVCNARITKDSAIVGKFDAEYSWREVMADYRTIADNTPEQEQAAGTLYARVEREYPEVAERANNLCKVLGLYGFWNRVNSARYEIAKALLAEKGITI